MKILYAAVAAAVCLLPSACSVDEPDDDGPTGGDVPSGTEVPGTDVPGAKPDPDGDFRGFYVLNEGEGGEGNASLDYYSYAKGTYTSDIYTSVNPGKGILGDHACGIAAHGGYVYVLVVGSDRIVVLDEATAVVKTEIALKSPRAIAFDSGYGYVTCSEEGKGYVCRIDTRDFSLHGSVPVGIKPEGLAIAAGKLYVANAGDYMDKDYENYISVVDLATFTTADSISAPINLKHIAFDAYGRLWTSSRGNYVDKASRIAVYEFKDGAAVQGEGIDTPVSAMTIVGDTLYYIGTSYDDKWQPVVAYGTVRLSASGYEEGEPFVSDGSESRIAAPYAVAVNPDNGDIIVTDAGDYRTAGRIFCYGSDGKLQWSSAAGVVPGHVVFVE
ncbi:MAG: hypothetical protein J6J93_02565 [Muribaculaceae bacterium]|nr:hypothetical protein [Muribaculaceae bacterium]